VRRRLASAHGPSSLRPVRGCTEAGRTHSLAGPPRSGIGSGPGSVVRDSPPLTHSYMGMYRHDMARAATTTDAFNAVAEPRRRQIVDLLAGGERPVGDLVRELGLGQPQASKHLRVLREVGLVEVREHGRQRLYRLDARALKPIHDWVKGYETLWSERFELLDDVLEDLKKEQRDANGD